MLWYLMEGCNSMIMSGNLRAFCLSVAEADGSDPDKICQQQIQLQRNITYERNLKQEIINILIGIDQSVLKLADLAVILKTKRRGSRNRSVEGEHPETP